jgi:hypothetical protein
MLLPALPGAVIGEVPSRLLRCGAPIYRCWVSECQILSDLDANARVVAIERLKLENEGWERDAAVTEPVEPLFNERKAAK